MTIGGFGAMYWCRTWRKVTSASSPCGIWALRRSHSRTATATAANPRTSRKTGAMGKYAGGVPDVQV